MATEPGVTEQLGGMGGVMLRKFWDWLMNSPPNYDGASVGSVSGAFGRAALGSAGTTMAGNVLSWILPGQSKNLFDGVLGKGLAGGALGGLFNLFSGGQNDGAGVGVLGGLAMQALSGDAGIVKNMLMAVVGVFLLPELAKGLSSAISAFNGQQQVASAAPGMGMPAPAG